MPKLSLLRSDNVPFYYNDEYLKVYKEELEELLDGLKQFKTLKFAKQSMLYQGIKYNNTIEGINDDLSLIEKVIRRRKTPMSIKQKKRITNLYHAYKYILANPTIDKEHLHKLYSILSDSLLEASDEAAMGEYYRLNEVVIEDDIHMYGKSYKGLESYKIDEFMNMLFVYINDAHPSNDIEAFITSQIMHFYFVYIHPFYDVNGRTSRTLSMWYLLNNKSYAYIVFNRAISFSKKEYYKRIEEARSSSDLTLFLKYMLIQVERELEKEYVILKLKEITGANLNHEERQTLQYLLSMKGSIEEGNLTVKDLASVYNRFNPRHLVREILTEKVEPLIEKGVLLRGNYTNSNIAPNIPNFNLCLNPNILDTNPSKSKHLSLKRYIK